MVEVVRSFFLALKARFGINLTIFYDGFDFDRFATGIATTTELVVLCIAFSVIIGLIGAVVLRLSKGPAAMLVKGYVAVIRNTPLLIQMYFFYFGLSSVLPAGRSAIGLPVPLVGNFAWAIVSLSLYAGAFNVESFRAGLGAVNASYEEAALALGYTPTQALRHIILPLGLRFSFASLANNLVDLTKSTTVAYAIGVSELLYVSNQIWSDSLNTFEMMNVILVAYLLLTGVVVWGIAALQRALRLPGFGAN
jgi:polar amino acid transport system permease protein